MRDTGKLLLFVGRSRSVFESMKFEKLELFNLAALLQHIQAKRTALDALATRRADAAIWAVEG